MHFVRKNSTKQKVVALNDIPTLKTHSETLFSQETISEVPVEGNASTSIEVAESDESNEEEALSFPEVVSNSFPTSVQDSTTISAEEAQDITNEALRAENLGKWSLRLALFFFLFVAAAILLSFTYSPFSVALTIFFLVLSFASLIMSIILGTKSLRAAYNTPKGRSRAIAGVIISSIILALILGLGFL